MPTEEKQSSLPYLVEEGVPGHIKDVHFNLTVSDLHSGTRDRKCSEEAVHSSRTGRSQGSLPATKIPLQGADS